MNMQNTDNYKTFEASYNKLLNINTQRINDLRESIPFIKDNILRGIAMQELTNCLNENCRLLAPMEAEKDGR